MKKEHTIVRLWRRLVALGPSAEIASSGLRHSLAASLRGVEHDPAAVATAARITRALVRATRLVAARTLDEGHARADLGGGWTLSSQESEARVDLQRTEGAVPDTTPLPPGAGVPLDLVLVDAATGRVAGLRRVAMPGAFALALHGAIVAQAAAPFDRAAYDARVQALAAEDAGTLAARAQHRATVGGTR